MSKQIYNEENWQWLNTPVEEAASRLLGCELEREIDGEVIRVRIVETEAYDQEDAASHAYNGRTERNAAMFLGAGHLYVYFTYGMHYCCNIVTGEAGHGSGVLIRAVEPISGMPLIERNRKLNGISTTNGPAKLCQALAIDRRFSGHDLASAPLVLYRRPALASSEIMTTTRIGISKSKDRLRRFYIKDSVYVSKR